MRALTPGPGLRLYSGMRRLVSAAAVFLATPPSSLGARAQSRYDMYGDPVDVTVQSLADKPESYDGRAVRVKGRFELARSPWASAAISCGTAWWRRC